MKNIEFLTLVCLMFICSCTSNKTLWRIQKNGLYGFIDSVGQVIIEPQYQYVGQFHDGYACVISSMKMSKDSVLIVKYGYINVNNEIVIDTVNSLSVKANSRSGLSKCASQYANKSFDFRTRIFRKLDLRDDRFLFQDPKTKLFGYKDSEGNIVVAPKYYEADAYSYGRAVVTDTVKFDNSKFDITKLMNRTGVIDVDGNVLVKPKYGLIHNYSKTGKTWACYFSQDNGDIRKHWVLLDEHGNSLTPSILVDYIYNNSEDGPYIVVYSDLFGVFYTFVDNNGHYLTDYDHDDEITIISFDEKMKQETFRDVTAFRNGYAGVRCTYDGHPAWVFVNEQMKSLQWETNSVPYDSVQNFSEGLAPVKEWVIDENYPDYRPGKWGYLDIHAKLVIPFSFSECGVFDGALAYFKNYGSNTDIEGYIDKKGNIVWQAECSK